ncbi:MAG: hypothetical protein WCI71_19130 [Bacteroidota bacterium]
MVSGLIAILTIFIILPAFSQETSNKESKSTIKLKFVNEKNGKTTVFDTTIMSNSPLDQKDINAIMEEMEADRNELAGDVKELRINMGVDIPDSLISDSVQKIMDKVIMRGHGAKCRGMKMNRGTCVTPDQFDFPCMPDCQRLIDDMGGNDLYEGMPMPNRQCKRFLNRQESLSDLIGDIPLDKVKNYSIKDRKGGKRITIDIDNPSPFDNQERIIYLERPECGSGAGHMQKHAKNVRVIIKTDKDSPEQPEKP